MAASNKKFNLTELLNQRSKEAAPQGQQGAAEAEKDTAATTASTTADIYDLIPSKDNFYSVEDVQDLKQSIELLGILQPLLVTDEEDGKRRIIAGHRRRLAIMQLVDEGKERFRYVPIMVKPTKNAILDRLALIMTNRFREKTDWEKMTESIETEKLVQELKAQMDIPGRTRDLLAEIIDASPATLGRYKAIYNNLAAELMAEFKAGKIGVSVIYEISQLEKEFSGCGSSYSSGWFIKSSCGSYPMHPLSCVFFPAHSPLCSHVAQRSFCGSPAPSAAVSLLSPVFSPPSAVSSVCGASGVSCCPASVPSKFICPGICAAASCCRLISFMSGNASVPFPRKTSNVRSESMTSLCYSCTQYETCHEKKATVTSCNAYENRTEAYKTDEQRYNEEQARIDAETRRKLRERQQEETMQQ